MTTSSSLIGLTIDVCEPLNLASEMGTPGLSHSGTWYKFVPLMLFGGSWSMVSESDPICLGRTLWR
jgi:hypothetical protein